MPSTILLNAGVFVAAVKLVGDVTIFAAVGTEVGIEKKKPDMAYTGLPDLDGDLAAGKLHCDGKRRLPRIEYGANRQIVELEMRWL